MIPKNNKAHNPDINAGKSFEKSNNWFGKAVFIQLPYHVGPSKKYDQSKPDVKVKNSNQIFFEKLKIPNNKKNRRVLEQTAIALNMDISNVLAI